MKNIKITFLAIIVLLLSLNFKTKPVISDNLPKADSTATDIQAKSRQVDELFELANENVPGASVMVIHKGEIMHNKGYGLANMELHKPNTPGTIFYLGSVTKPFTALAILQLYDKGKLNLDDAIEKYLPETANGDIVTIKNLLTHTSGIQAIDNPELEFAPGELISYSNDGYNLLGKIIEKVSGLTYQKYLQDNILTPLGMDNTGFGHPETNVDSLAMGYQFIPDGSYIIKGNADVSGAYAAGGLYSTVEDMYKWDQALYTGKLAKKSTLNKAFSQAKLNDGNAVNYGYGWMTSHWRGINSVGHGGDITGFNSYIARFPNQNFTVIVLSNIEMRPPAPLPSAGTLAFEITEIYLTDKLAPPKVHEPIEVDSLVLEKYVGAYRLTKPESIAEVLGEIITISRRGNNLYALSKLGEAEILIDSDILFYMRDNSTIRFTGDGENITGMVVDAMGLGLRTYKAEKVE
jgi:CubicO group peptidase (beta-lactamase class C family)